MKAWCPPATRPRRNQVVPKMVLARAVAISSGSTVQLDTRADWRTDSGGGVTSTSSKGLSSQLLT